MKIVSLVLLGLLAAHSSAFAQTRCSTDPYGNTATHVAIDLTYSRETLNKINFDGITKASIWEIRDSGTILPAFQP